MSLVPAAEFIKRLWPSRSAWKGACWGLIVACAVVAIDDANGKRFDMARQLIRKHYITEFSDDEIKEKALQALMGHLDKHSEYLTERGIAVLDERDSGQYGGIGITVDEQMAVLEVAVGGPAAKAGLMAGDDLLSVDGQSAPSLGREGVSNRVRGHVGQAVNVVWQHGTKKQEANIPRESVKAPTVSSAVITEQNFRNLGQASGPTLLIRITEFGGKTYDDLLDCLEAHRGVVPQAVVLDLRDNGGGLMTSLPSIGSVFLPKRSLLLTKKTRKEEVQQFTEPPDERKPAIDLKQVPLAILVNQRTGSSSETLSAALRDHGRAILVGQKTYGKGTFQEFFNLDETHMLRLTVGEVLPPKSGSFHKTGLAPDIEVSTPNDEHAGNTDTTEAAFSRKYLARTNDAVLKAALSHLWSRH